MDIRDQLNLAVIMRNLKRRTATSPANDTANVGAYLNRRLAETLPSAIASDKSLVTLEVARVYVPSNLWEELESYLVADWTVPHKFIMEDYADEVYRPYLVGSKVTRGRNNSVLEIAFYLSQN